MNKQERNRIKQILVITIIGWLLILGFNYLIELPGSKADQLCPISGTVHGIVTLQPENGNNVIDCSAQDVVIANDGELVVERYYTANGSRDGDGGAIFLVRNLTVEAGGKITATGKGYRPGESDNGSGNAVASTDNVGGSGGGYGGAGGEGMSNGIDLPGATGGTYGDEQVPTYLGGAGGNSGSTSGANGGGAIKIMVSQTLIHDGTIEANGEDSKLNTDNTVSSGAGAGGSIWIAADSIAGSGLVTANGGDAPETVYRGGGGGGGRIVMVCQSSISYSGDVTVNPGDGNQDGQLGTIIGPGCIPDTPSISKVFEGNGIATRELDLGDLTKSTTLTLASNLIDPNPNATVRMQVELREIGQTFTGNATHTQTAYVVNPKPCTSPLTDCGYLTINSIGTSKEYKYRVRAVNDTGVVSSWFDVGANGDSADFTVVGPASGFVKVAGDEQTGIVGQQLNNVVQAKMVDAAGFGIPLEPVVWQVLTGSGTYANQGTSTDEFGLVSSNWTLGTVSGTNNNSLQVSKSGLGSTGIFLASANPGPLNKFSVVAPQVVTVSTNFTITVNALDQYNNQTPFTGSATISATAVDGINPGVGTLIPGSINLIDGVFTSSTVNYSVAEVIRIKIDDGSSHTGLSNTVVVATSMGNCPDIDIDNNQEWKAVDVPGGIYDCRGLGTINIRDGVSLTLTSYDSGDTNYGNDYGVTILADSINVFATAIIDSNGKGYQEGRGPGYGGTNGSAYGGYSQNGIVPIGDVYEPFLLGSGGVGSYGSVGHGGGAIKIITTSDFTNNGTIRANALYSGDSGGGTGGSIWLDVANLNGSGTFSANGSARFDNWSTNVAGGSGGRISIYYTGGDFPFSNMDKIQARGYSSAGPGTIYIERKGVDVSKGAHLYVDNNGGNGQPAGLLEGTYEFTDIHLTRYGHLKVIGQSSILELTNGEALLGDTTKSSLIVEGTINYTGLNRLSINGVDLKVSGRLQGVSDFILGDTIIGGMTLYANTWYYNSTVPHTFNDVEIGANGILTLVSYDSGDTIYTNDYLIEFNASNVLINAGGKISGDGTGYQQGRGIAYGGSNGSAHGGYSQNGVLPVGDVYEPILLGSGGVGTYGAVGHGGAAIKMNISGILTNNGTLSANALYASGNSGGGTGGSLWLNLNQIDGSGLIAANGSPRFDNWAANIAGGSGGRIAIYYQSGNFPLTNMDNVITRGYSSAGPGTIYLEQLGVDASKGAHLYIDNNGENGQPAGLLEGIYEFMDIHQTRYGHLKVLGQGSILEITAGAALNGDSTKSSLIVEGTINYTGLDRLYINGIDLTVSGKMQGVTDFTLGNTLIGGITLFAHTWYYNDTVPHEFGDIEIGANGILTLVSYDSGDTVYTNDYLIELNASNILINSGGKITGDGKGYQQGRGIAYGGGNGSAHGGYSANGTVPVGDVYEPILLGSGGVGSYGYVAHGGAAIKMHVSGTLTNNGSLSANAVYASGNAGGSAGGSLWLDVDQLNGNGTISANGSTSFGNWATSSAGGSGGRIAIYYTGGDFALTNMDKVTARGYSSAGPGTIYIEQKGVDTIKGAHLYIDNNGSNGQSAGLLEGVYEFMDIHQTRYGHLKVLGQNGILEITAGAALNGDSTKPALTVDGTINYSGLDRLYINGIDLTVSGRLQGVTDFTLGNTIAGGMTLYAHTWYYNADVQHNYGDVEIGTNGVLTLVSYDSGDTVYSNDYLIEFNADNVLINSGGKITGDGKGYQQGRGIAYGGGNGSAHGGYSANGVAPVGDVYEPILLGSGGVGSYGYVAHGGAAIKMQISGTLTNNGSLSANAVYASGNAGGSTGGSIWLDVDQLNGTGTISANGSTSFGNWATSCAGGSGGRIAIYYSGGDFPLTNMDKVTVRGYSSAGPGTIYIEQKGVDTLKGAHLYIDNNGGNGQSAGLLQGVYKFMDIHQTRYGHLKVLGQEGVLEITAGAALNGDSTKPSLSADGTINYTGTDRLLINGIDLTISGRLQGVSDFTLGDTLAGGMTLYANTWYYNDTTTHQFGDVEIGANGTLTLVAYNNGDTNYTNDYPISLTVNNLLVQPGGFINSNGKGYTQRTGPGYGGGSGSGYGGYSAGGIASRGDPYYPTMLGSGGIDSYGYAAHGGGALIINSNGTFTHNGRLEANALYTSNNAGGGTGGSIIIHAGILNGNGTIKANGAGSFGNWATSVQGGSGGRIALFVESSDFPYTQSANVQALGASGGGPGTIYVVNSALHTDNVGSLYIQGNSGRTMDFEARDWNFHDFYIGSNITTWMKSDLVENRGVVFNLNGDFTLSSGAQILGNGVGYPSASGPGKGNDAILQNGGGGGAHGGNGGNGESSDGFTVTAGGEKYGNQFYPLNVGSGGGKGGTGAAGGVGGGSVAIVSRTGNVNILGNISMNGTNGLIGSPGGGGGAGGSIIVHADSCQIDGNLSAIGGNGGDNTFDGGGGGGGRVSIVKVYGECDVLGTVSVEMGSSAGGQIGQIGTYAGVVTLPQIELESQNKLTGELIPVGGVISDNQVRFSVGVSDPGASEAEPADLRVNLELVDTGHDFTDIAQVMSINSNSISYTGGEPEAVDLTTSNNLEPGEEYKWRARVTNVGNGIISEWQEFGDNGNEADFSISDTTAFDVYVNKTTVEIGEVINITVSALDELSQVVPEYLGTITFGASPLSDPGPNLPSNYTFSAGDAGVHIFNNELMFFSPGDYQVIITDVNNPSITGVSAWITVLAPPATPTPTPTDTPLLTETPIPGVSSTVTPTSETSPTPSTDNVLASVTPTTLTEEEDQDCFDNPLQAKCQVNVVISNVRVTVDNEVLSAEICFDTNIATVGVIKYGTESYTDSSEVEKTYRVKNHCITLNNLASAMGYVFKIEVVSYAGKRGSYEGTFVTEGGVTPVIVEPKECIVVNSTSFTDDHRAVLDYETSGPALCQVSYGALGRSFTENLPKDEEELIKHRSYLDLIKIEPYTDLMYRILCEVKDGDKVNSCEVMDVISWNKIKTYYPEEGYRNWQWNELVGRIGEGLPFVGISFLGFMMLANLFAFPQLPLYGLFVLRRKKRGNPWGVVYDKEKKIPVSFAVLRLYDTTGKLIEQSVSNLEGKYGFVVDKGDYRLEVVQSGYQSTIREVKVLENETVISEDIGLSRKTPTSMRINLKQQISVLTKYLVYIGFVISLVAWLISPEPLNLIILLLYIGQAIYLWSMRMKDFGVVKSGILKMKGAFVRVYDIEQGRQIEVGMSDSKGRYQIPVKPGRYLLGAYTPGYELAEQPTLITKNGQKFLEIRVAGDKVREEIELRQV